MAQGNAPTEVPPDAMGAVSVSVTGLKKFFGPTRALDGCNFSANFGEIHAIVGGNGCGKSTLAKVLSGVLPADGGRVSVLGRATLTPHEARDIGVATVFQEVLVADECSVVDNLFMGADGLFSSSMSGSAKMRTAQALVHDLVGAPVDVRALAGTLPLGFKQWITIGRALLRNPRILILDEFLRCARPRFHRTALHEDAPAPRCRIDGADRYPPHRRAHPHLRPRDRVARRSRRRRSRAR